MTFQTHCPMQMHLKVLSSHIALSYSFSQHLSLLSLTYLFLTRNSVTRTEKMPGSFTTVSPIPRVVSTQSHPNVLLNEFSYSSYQKNKQPPIAITFYLLFSRVPVFVLSTYFLNLLLTLKYRSFFVIWILQMSNLLRVKSHTQGHLLDCQESQVNLCFFICGDQIFSGNPDLMTQL